MSKLFVSPRGFFRSVSIMLSPASGEARRTPRNRYTSEIEIAHLRAFRG